MNKIFIGAAALALLALVKNNAKDKDDNPDGYTGTKSGSHNHIL